jgi:hypothetical protein
MLSCGMLFNTKALCLTALAMTVSSSCLGDVLTDDLQVTCDVPGFSVQAETGAEARQVCRVISAALPQLRSCHLSVQNPVHITVSEELADAPARCLGYYQCDQSEIHIRSAQGMERVFAPDSVFGQVGLDAFFESIVVHEVAHALFQQNACVTAACIDNHEYVAHAMQMAWLPDDQRALILDAYPTETPVDPMRLNSFIAAMAPERYAALVWQHFNQPENGCDFVQGLLSGDVSLQLQLFPD